MVESIYRGVVEMGGIWFLFVGILIGLLINGSCRLFSSQIIYNLKKSFSSSIYLLCLVICFWLGWMVGGHFNKL
jgi:spore maturation protein SpmA